MMRLGFFFLATIVFSLSFVGCSSRQKEEKGNVIHLASQAKIRGLDPIFAEDRYAGYEVMRVYEGLLQYHPFKRPYTLEPLLAAEMPKVTNGGLTYTFKIRQGVFFHDNPAFPEGKGRELVAEDIVYSFKRIADMKNNSTSWWIFDGRVKGLNEWREQTKKSEKSDYSVVIPGMKTLDKYTVQFQLTKPYPQFLNALAMPNTLIVAREAVEKYGKEFINYAVGTGPFVLETFKPAEIVTYNKNPKYWNATFPSDGSAGDKEAGLLEDAGKSLPLADRVEVRVIVEEQPRWLHFTKGEIDYSSIPKDYFKQAVSADGSTLTPEFEKKGIRLSKTTALDLTYTAFNNASSDIPQFKDKRVRQAISLALDEDEMIPTFYNNMAAAAQSVIPPGISGSMDPDFKNPYRTGDIEKAKKLLASAGFPEGKGFPEIVYDTLADTTSRQMSEYVSKRLALIGLKIKVNTNTWPALTERIQRRQTQMWGIAWGADYPDAENFLQLFYGGNAQPGGMNGSYYKNPKFDALFEKARIMQDSPARTKLYKELALMLVEDCPIVLGVHRIAVVLVHPWFKNYKYSEFHINQAKYYRVDKAIKKQYRQ